MRQSDKRITWDGAKNKANKGIHGISFEEAATVFYDQLSVTVDDPDHSDYQRRFHIIGESRLGRLIVISFAETPDQIRIIKPTKKEKNDYKEGRH